MPGTYVPDLTGIGDTTRGAKTRDSGTKSVELVEGEGNEGEETESDEAEDDGRYCMRDVNEWENFQLIHHDEPGKEFKGCFFNLKEFDFPPCFKYLCVEVETANDRCPIEDNIREEVRDQMGHAEYLLFFNRAGVPCLSLVGAETPFNLEQYCYSQKLQPTVFRLKHKAKKLTATRFKHSGLYWWLNPLKQDFKLNDFFENRGVMKWDQAMWKALITNEGIAYSETQWLKFMQTGTKFWIPARLRCDRAFARSPFEFLYVDLMDKFLNGDSIGDDFTYDQLPLYQLLRGNETNWFWLNQVGRQLVTQKWFQNTLKLYIPLDAFACERMNYNELQSWFPSVSDVEAELCQPMWLGEMEPLIAYYYPAHFRERESLGDKKLSAKMNRTLLFEKCLFKVSAFHRNLRKNQGRLVAVPQNVVKIIKDTGLQNYDMNLSDGTDVLIDHMDKSMFWFRETYQTYRSYVKGFRDISFVWVKDGYDSAKKPTLVNSDDAPLEANWSFHYRRTSDLPSEAELDKVIDWKTKSTRKYRLDEPKKPVDWDWPALDNLFHNDEVFRNDQTPRTQDEDEQVPYELQDTANQQPSRF